MPDTRRRFPKPDRPLALPADSPDGVTDAALAAHGVTAAQIAELAAAGLVIATAQRMGLGPREIEVTRVRITGAGRRALAGHGEP